MKRFVTAAAVAISATVFPLLAAGQSAVVEPADLPPPDYAAERYVDSTGCVFVRAEHDGAAAWIPQLTESRVQLCGFEPTFPAAAAAAPAEPDEAEAPRQAAPASRPATTIRVAGPDRSAVVKASCSGSTIRQAGPSGYSVTCAGAEVQQRAGTAVFIGSESDLDVGAIPRAPRIAPPPGYERVWEDGRLNPDSGKQLLSGAVQTGLVWTQTVPRRLIDRSSGEDVTQDLRMLIYPYTDYDRQLSALRSGEAVVVRTARGRVIVPRDRLGTDAQGRAVIDGRVSTKADPSAAPGWRHRYERGEGHRSRRDRYERGEGRHGRGDAERAGKRYVQIGAFGSRDNARRALGELRRMGFPARLGTIERGGRDLRAVFAGPFGDPRRARSALRRLRGAGYGDAFLRR